MKKIFLILSAIIIFTLLGIYILLFTTFGNSIIKDKLEQKITTFTQLPVTITKFKLSPSNILLSVKSDNAFEGTLNSDFSILSKNISGKFDGKVLDFSKFEKFTKRKLIGKCNISSTFSGNIDQDIKVDIKSNIFDGDSRVKLTIKKGKPNELFYILKDLKIESILLFLTYKNYSNGFIDSKGNINFLEKKGSNETMFTGRIENELINKDFDLTLPPAKFNGKVIKTLKDNSVSIFGKVYSDLANITIDNSSFNLTTKDFKSDYTISIPNISLLKGITKHKLKGNSQIEGKLFFNKELLTTGLLRLNKNLINYEFKESKLYANSDKLDFMDLLKTLSYPQVFETYAKLDFIYDLPSKSGKIALKFDSGVLKNIDSLKDFKRYTGVDFDLEIYKNGFMNCDIKDKILNIVFDLKSQKTEISSKKTIIDSEKGEIDSLINLDILGMPIGMHLSDNVSKPTIKINTKELLKNQLISPPDPIEKIDEKKVKKDIKKGVKKLKGNLKNIKNKLFKSDK